MTAARPPGTWSSLPTCPSPRASSIRRHRPARSRLPNRRRARRLQRRPIRTRHRRHRPPVRATPIQTSPSPARTSSSATTTASIPTTSSAPTSRGCWRRSCAREARVTYRSTATCCSCRSSRRAAASTAACRAWRRRCSAERFLGVRIFDITDLRNPKQVAAVQTCRGSHTHTLILDPNDKANIYIYGSGTGRVRSGEELTGCSGGDPKEDKETALFSIDVIQVPLANPSQAQGRQPSARLRRRGRQHRRRCGRAAITAPARSRPARRTSATTSPCIRRSAWPPAPARATAS